ncbi:hypothetical protein N2152v2_004691 [Parachlorella kessleri]
MVKVQLEHIAAGCNRCVNAVSWGGNGLVAYGAHHAVIIYNPEAARVVAAVLGHTGTVNCVNWVPPSQFSGCPAVSDAPEAPVLLASGAADNTGHTAPLTSLTTISLSPGRLLLVSTAGDGDVLIWECAAESPAVATQGAWRLCQRLHVGFQMQACAALAHLPANPDWLLLALGGVDSHVRLYACRPGGDFREVCKLSGHQDWVRGLAFAQMDDGGRLLLASASQDKYVRVWAIRLEPSTPSATPAPPSTAAELIARYAPKPHITTPSHTYSATLEALLVGHEDWVHSVAWHPPVLAQAWENSGELAGQQGQRWVQPPCLLSASMDRTMMVWKPDQATGLWMSVETVGDAGPNHLGYYTGVFNGDGTGILAHGFTGALHIWRRLGGAWHALGGHVGPVVDACWGVGDSCLLTVSSDQTARITSRLHDGHWCEIARPQVHGHDFSSAAFIPCPSTPGRFLYASGSEEKVIRVFEAPRAFQDTLAMARGEAVAPSASSRSAFGASLPALGLSNKAVYADANEEPADGNGSSLGGDYTDGPDFAPNAAPSAVAGPPLEEHLAQNTLWPEVRKLYGHGNDVYCLASDPQGRYLASACRAQSASAAGIWVWDAVSKWVGLGILAAHSLTVTQLAFSPDGRYLASASRDRCVALFEHCGQEAETEEPGRGSPPFRLAAKIKAHARIVWSLGWSHDSRLLATGSRDNTVKVWGLPTPHQQQQRQQSDELASTAAAAPSLLATLPFDDAVRAVAFAPVPATPDTIGADSVQVGTHHSSVYLLAVGLESGSVRVVELQCCEGSLVSEGCPAGAGLSLSRYQVSWESGAHTSHAAAVRRLCWRRDTSSSSSSDAAAAQATAGQLQRLHLASVGDDHAVRVFGLEL